MTSAIYTAAQIDDLAIAYDQACINLEQAQQAHSAAKGSLLAAIRAQGYVPPRADKTMRVEGAIYIADATTSSTVDINEGAVGELESELSRLKKPSLFRKLFDRKIKHTLRENAGDQLKLDIGGMAEEMQTRLLGLFASCFTVKSKTPTVTVTLAKALREKEEKAARKAEAKAARAAKKK